MNGWQSVAIALRALRANRLRSALTLLGIVIGVGAVIAMVAIGNGAQKTIETQLRSLGSNLLMVQPGAARSGGVRLGAGSRHTLTEDDAAAIASEVPSVLVASPVVTGGMQLIRGNANWATRVAGSMPDYLAAREWVIARGNGFVLADVDAAAKVAVIGATIAEELFADEDPIGQTLRVGDTPFTVIGVLQSKGQSPSGRNQDDVIFVPLSTAKLRLLGATYKSNRRAVELIVVKVASAAAMVETERQIGGLLRQRHRLRAGAEDDFIVRDLSAVAKAQSRAARTFSYLLAAVASVSLIVGGISIMNSMLVSVTERTREIGLRLAVGARQRDIRNQFLIEALTLCLLGGIIGIATGAAAAYLVARIAGWASRFE